MSAAIEQLHGARRKQAATLAARLALKGFALVELADGSFVISKWNLVSPSPLPDLDAVERFAAQVGA